MELVGRDAAALDACGGSGYASSVLLELGARPVTVDISAEMLARWREKAESVGYDAPTVEAEVGEFLAATDEVWDVIVFSSALHHLEDYLGVVELAVHRLTPGGVLVTAFDPIAAGRVVQVIRHLDHLVALLIRHPREFFSKGFARGRRTRTGEPHIGYLAEFHARTGIDDLAIRDSLQRRGVEVVLHDRDYGARLGVSRVLLRALRSPSSFRLLAQRTANYSPAR